MQWSLQEETAEPSETVVLIAIGMKNFRVMYTLRTIYIIMLLLFAIVLFVYVSDYSLLVCFSEYLASYAHARANRYPRRVSDTGCTVNSDLTEFSSP